MTDFPRRLLLDTNIFVIGFLEPTSPEATLLTILETKPEVVLIFSNDLETQIRRVGKRLQNSDWVGLLLHYIWSTYSVEYGYITAEEMAEVQELDEALLALFQPDREGNLEIPLDPCTPTIQKAGRSPARAIAGSPRPAATG